MRLALGQRALRHRSGGVQPDQSQWVVEQGRRPLAHRLQPRRPQLIRGPRPQIGHHPRTCLQEGPHLARRSAGDIGRAASVMLGQQFDHRPRVPMRPRRQDEGVVLNLHQSALITPTTARALSFGTAKLRTYCSIFQPPSVSRSTPDPRVVP
ncbi:hypothetical protein D3C86_1294430 [compost metagenome]